MVEKRRRGMLARQEMARGGQRFVQFLDLAAERLGRQLQRRHAPRPDSAMYLPATPRATQPRIGLAIMNAYRPAARQTHPP